MQVGEKEAFPICRALSVRSTIGQIQTVTAMRFSTRSEYPDFIVTREQQGYVKETLLHERGRFPVEPGGELKKSSLTCCWCKSK